MTKHIYSKKAFGSLPFHVVHMRKDGTPTSAVGGFNEVSSAQGDADDRNERAEGLNLDCTYVVRTREEGEAIEG